MPSKRTPAPPPTPPRVIKRAVDQLARAAAPQPKPASPAKRKTK